MPITHNKSLPRVESRPPGKRKAHTRSKRGCSNCRLRRVKCDEKRPDCEKCRKAHIACTYETEFPHLQSFHEQAVTCIPLVTPQLSNNTAALGVINGALFDYYLNNPETGHVYQLDIEGLSFLFRFQSRAVRSIGSQWDTGIWETELIRLVSLNPYLLHVCMTCTAMHDRYLDGQSHRKRTVFESYHWALSSQLLRHEMSQTSRAYDRDAIFMAAVLINWIVLYAVETRDPEEVWPLSPMISELPWFPIQKGMRSIWQLAEPYRANSLFFKSANDRDERCLGLTPPKHGIDGISPVLVALCGLDESSNPENNPYHAAVRALSTLLDHPSADLQSLKFMGFVNSIDDGFEAMLRERDPRSLLLMAIWYGLVPKFAWWIALRAELERKAICIYLDRWHANDPLISRVLATF